MKKLLASLKQPDVLPVFRPELNDYYLCVRHITVTVDTIGLSEVVSTC
jgi:hypothetical protein